MSQTYILRAFTEDDYQQTACSHVVAALEAAEAGNLLELKALIERVGQGHPGLFRMEFWNDIAALVLVRFGDLSDRLDGMLRESVAAAPAGFSMSESEAETSLGSEYAILVADRWGVSFRFCIRHEGTSLHTGDITWESIEEAAKS
jgi:hypothetical protein